MTAATPTTVPSSSSPPSSLPPPPAASPSSSSSPSASSSPLLQSDSVWQALLQRSTRRKDLLPTSTIILLGPSSSTSPLISSLTSLSDPTLPPPSSSTPYLFSYSYLNVKNRHNADREEVLGRLNIWQLDESTPPSLLPLLLSPTPATLFSALTHTLILLCVDLSSPATLTEQLAHYSTTLQSISSILLSPLSPSDRHSLHHAISLHTQSYYTPDIDPTLLSPHIPELNLGLPLILIGTNPSSLPSIPLTSSYSSLSLDDRLEYVVYLLRTFALPSSSAILFTTSEVDTLLSYIYHRLYHFPLDAQPSPLATSDHPTLFIPAGYDSADLIATGQTKEGRWVGVRSDQLFVRDKKAVKEGKTSVKAMDDAAFTKQMQFQLDNNTSTPLPLPPLPSIPTRPSSSSVPSPSASHESSPRGKKGGGGVSTKDPVAVKAFFKSLLNAPGGVGGGVGEGGGSKRSSMRKEAELELKRMSEAMQAKEKEKSEQKE